MWIGVFGTRDDPQTEALQALLAKRGAATVMVYAYALDRGVAHSFDGSEFDSADQFFADVGAWFLRHIMSPLPPAFATDDDYRRFADWYVEYMRRRERAAYQLA